MRILITGATGFVGKYLVSLLASRRHEIFGTYFLHEQPVANCRLLQCDLRDEAALRETLTATRPDRIYHLAARSSVTHSYEDARSVYETNFWGAYNLMEAMRRCASQARILIVGSGHCYGRVKPGNLPVVETHSLSSHSPYATSKAAADLLGYQFFAGYGLYTVRARPFNHTGPGQPPAFVCSDFARQAAAIELGTATAEISVGSLSVQRDFSDVRDVVRAYELMLEKGVPGEAYNVASGRCTSIRMVVQTLISFCSRPVRIVSQANRLRKVEERKLYGSTAKLRRATGWKPRRVLEQTLRDLFDDWKIKLRAS